MLGSVLDQDESGDGGIQRGQVTEIWGPPGSGKTAFGYVCGPDIHDFRLKLTCLCSVQLAAHCLRDGGEVVWVGPSLSLSQRRVSLHLLTSTDFTHRVSFERMRHVVGASIGTQDEDATLAFLDMVTYYMFDSLPHFVAQICRPTWHVPPATALIVIDSLSALLTYAFPREDDTEDPGAPGAPGKPPGPAPPGDAKDKKSWLALLSDSGGRSNHSLQKIQRPRGDTKHSNISSGVFRSSQRPGILQWSCSPKALPDPTSNMIRRLSRQSWGQPGSKASRPGSCCFETGPRMDWSPARYTLRQ